MPTYEYKCKDCDHQFDIVQSFTDDALTTCPSCRKTTLRKVFSPVGIVLKGSGFYKNDSRSGNGKSSSASTSATSDSANGSSSDSTSSSDTKSSSSSDTKSSSSSDTTSSDKKGSSSSDKKAAANK